MIINNIGYFQPKININNKNNVNNVKPQALNFKGHDDFDDFDEFLKLYQNPYATSINSTYDEYDIKEQAAINKFLDKGGRLTKKQFDDFKKAYPRAISTFEREISDETSLQPNLYAKAAIAIRKMVDCERKIDDPRIISIGTSPAAIANVMELMGSDVTYLPISGFSGFYSSYTYDDDDIMGMFKDQSRNAKTCFEYLKSKGFEGDCGGKPVIILDYSDSGNTLYNTRLMLEERNNIKRDDIITFPVGKILSAYSQIFDSELLSRKEQFELDRNMFYEHVAKISSTPHFELDNDYSDLGQEEIFYNFENFKNPLARKFAACAYNKVENFVG